MDTSGAGRLESRWRRMAHCWSLMTARIPSGTSSTRENELWEGVVSDYARLADRPLCQSENTKHSRSQDSNASSFLFRTFRHAPARFVEAGIGARTSDPLCKAFRRYRSRWCLYARSQPLSAVRHHDSERANRHSCRTRVAEKLRTPGTLGRKNWSWQSECISMYGEGHCAFAAVRDWVRGAGK